MKIPPEVPHFFKPILPGFIDGIEIPKSFFRFLGKRRPLDDQRALLRRPSGREWRVKIIGVFLREGWSEFAVQNSLEVGDIVVFQHQANMVFDVMIFDLSECEKEDHSTDHEETESDGIPYFISTIQPYSARWSYLNLPVEFSRSNGLLNRNCEIILKDGRERRWNLSLVPCDDGKRVRIRRGTTLGEFFAANGFREGDSFKFELTQNGEIPVVRILPPTSSARKATGPKSESHDRPYFTSTIQPAHIKGSYVHIPMKFARTNGLLEKGKMILIDKKQRSWPVLVKHYCGSHYRIYCGWQDFRKGSGLEEGDAFKFELVENGEVPVAHVTAFRSIANSVPAPPVGVGSKRRRALN